MAKVIEYRVIPLERIDWEESLQVRSGDWTQISADETAGFAELVHSLASFGQIDPIGVRWNRDARYQIVYGMRRALALKHISEQSGIRNKIGVLIWECTDDEARAMQIIQSSTTAQLEAPDVAIAAGNLTATAERMTDQDWARRLGMSPAFFATVMRVMRNASQEVLDRWKHDTCHIPLTELEQIVLNTDGPDQTFKYETTRDRLYNQGDELNVSTAMLDTSHELKDTLQEAMDAMVDLKRLLPPLDGELVLALGQLAQAKKAIRWTMRQEIPDHVKEALNLLLTNQTAENEKRDFMAERDPVTRAYKPSASFLSGDFGKHKS